MADLDIDGIRGAIGQNKSYKDANGKEFQGWETKKSFTFNDPSIDRGQLNSLSVGSKGITFVSDENINWIMGNSSIKEKSILNRWTLAFGESFGGMMDFNHNYTLPSQGIIDAGNVTMYDQVGGFMIFETSHTAYNLNDAGQFLWGQAMNRLGFDYSNAKIAAQLFARGYEFDWDTEADQNAIRSGFHYDTKIKAAIAGPFEGLADWRRDRK